MAVIGTADGPGFFLAGLEYKEPCLEEALQDVEAVYELYIFQPAYMVLLWQMNMAGANVNNGM